MWQTFTASARQSILKAQQLAVENHGGSVGPAHLFLGILELEESENSVVLVLLKVSGVSVEEARLYAQSTIDSETKVEMAEPKLSASAKLILEFAANEARRIPSKHIGPEHLFIACVRRQRGQHLGDVLRPLGLDAERLRQHLRSMNQTPHREGNPLNHVSKDSIRAIEAAYESMRASFCGRISSVHLLLGLLSDETNAAIELLRETGVDIDELRRDARAQIVSDGQIATPQRKFSDAAKRVLERAKREAKASGHPLIGPEHLLLGILPVADGPLKSFAANDDDGISKFFSDNDAATIRARHQQILVTQRKNVSSKPNERPTSRADPLAHLTARTQKAVDRAFLEMAQSGCNRVSPVHLLLGLLHDKENVAELAIRAAGLDSAILERKAREMVQNDGGIAATRPEFTATAMCAIARADRETLSRGFRSIGTEHLLLGLLPHEATSEKRAAFGNGADPLKSLWTGQEAQKIREAVEKMRPTSAPVASAVASSPQIDRRDRLVTWLPACCFLAAIVTCSLVEAVAAQPSQASLRTLFALLMLVSLLALGTGACWTQLFGCSKYAKGMWLGCFAAYLAGLMGVVFSWK